MLRQWNTGNILALSVIGAIASFPATAQITPDTTLGNESSRVTRNVTIRGGSGDRIGGGAARGSNLFHSFSDFNVNEGQRVYFANPAGVTDILSRVTGNTRSDIMGTLGVDGNANLFLLNPNGIIFGPNAQLDISGSFTASTADSVAFPDGTRFSASTPGDPALLSVAVPLGVQHGATPPGAITNAGNLSVRQNLSVSGGSVTSTGQLAAPSGQLLVEGVAGDVQVRQAVAQTATLSADNNLILQESQLQTAGDLNLLAGNTVQIRDSAANPFIAYAGGNLTVQGNQNVDIFALNHPSSGLVSGGDMVLRSPNPVGGDAHYWTGGNFRIKQLDSSLGDLFSPYDPIVRAGGDVNFGSYTGNSLHIQAGGSVTISGTITIQGAEPETGDVGTDFIIEDIPPLIDGLSDPILIDGSNEPTLDIRAGIDWTQLGGLINPTNALPLGATAPASPLLPFPAATGANISVGNIVNRSSATGEGEIYLTNQYRANIVPNSRIQTGQIHTYGDVNIGSQGNIEVAGIDTSNRSAIGNGRGGDITLRSTGGSITAAGPLDATGSSRAVSGSLDVIRGDVTLRASGDIRTASITSNLVSGGSGFGGNINLTSENGSIFPNGTISSNVEPGGRGFSGDIALISETGSIVLNGTTINADSIGDSIEGSGTIEVVAPQGSIRLNNAILRTANTGSGDAGDVGINAGNRIHITSSTIRAEGNLGRVYVGESFEDPKVPSGPPSTIVFNRSTLSTQNVITVGSNTVSSGVDANIRIDAGEIRIRATDSISILNRSRLGSDTFRNGNNGDITIQAGNAPIFDGNIRIGASIVSSQVLRGGIANNDNGSITIRAGSLRLSRGGQINTTLNDLQGPNSNINLDAAVAAPQGGAGNVNVHIRDDINISGGNRRAFSGIFSAVGNGNPNAGRDGRFNPRFLGLTFASGNGGRVRVTSDSLSINGSRAGIFTRTVANGDAGENIIVNTGFLTLANGGSLDNSTTRLVSNGITNGSGDAGDITVTADRIALNNGRITVAANSVLSNNRLVPGGGGTASVAGDVRINTGWLTLQNGSTVTVESQGQAGNLRITANHVTLDNSTLNADARNAGRTNSANINLRVLGTLLRLEGTRPRSLRTQTRSDALISANAIGAIDGGNITINAEDGFVLANANDNGDITANARDSENGEPSGNGGQVTINTNAIFGLERRDGETLLSDITATSQSGDIGTITLNTLNVDPTRGLGELPVDLVDPTSLVADGCVGRNRSGVTDQGEFTRTGRGGLSPNPGNPLTSEATPEPLATLDPSETPSDSASIPEVPDVQPLIEAQGLGLNDEGKVSLVSGASTTTVSIPEQSSVCTIPAS